jgi:hypothetical protein
MRTLRFGRTNAQVPAISLGTWGHGGPAIGGGFSVGWSGNDDLLSKAALVEAHRQEITHWDTADAYGNGHAERLIGEVFAGGVPRNDIFLATKFGYQRGGADHFYDPAYMRGAKFRCATCRPTSSISTTFTTAISVRTTSTSTTRWPRCGASATKARSVSSAFPIGIRARS